MHATHRLLAGLALAATISAQASPVTYAPNTWSPWLNVTAVAGTYSGFYFKLDLSDIQNGDTLRLQTASGLNGASPGGISSELLFPVAGVVSGLQSGGFIGAPSYNDGAFSVRLGAGVFSGSSITVDRLQIVLVDNNVNALSTIDVDLNPQAVPEPGALLLAASALLALGAGRRRR